MQKNSKLKKYFTMFSVITLILSIGIAPSLSFGFNPIGMTNLPIDQVEMEFAIQGMSCKPGTVLMIGSMGKPGCAPEDSVDQLEKYGWVVISKGAIQKPLQASAMTDKNIKCDVNNIHASDQCILYSITGGTVTGTTINSNDNSLVIRINAEDAGVLTVTPHSSVQKGIFMVLVDGEEWGDAQIVGNNVIVMFPEGTKEIELFGTSVIKGVSRIPILTDQSRQCGPNNIFASGICIPYNISSGIATSASVNKNDNSLVIRINAEDAGVLTVSPATHQQKGIFMVLVDGEEWSDVEILGNTVTVMYPAGAEEIEIIGTFVVSKSDTIAATTNQNKQCGINDISASGHCISYNISGGVVTGATINTNDNSVVISINAGNGGTLTVTPTTSQQKGIFMVLVDGEEWSDVEILGNTVTVMYPAGAEEIEIIGTFVVPEFGTIAAMILAVAIISIIAISAKSRLSIIPR